MVKISELSNWAWIWWTEQVPVNDSWTTVKYTVDQILARVHNHVVAQITDFVSSVTSLIDAVSVKLTGNQTIAGIKTFTSSITSEANIIQKWQDIEHSWRYTGFEKRNITHSMSVKNNADLGGVRFANFVDADGAIVWNRRRAIWGYLFKTADWSNGASKPLFYLDFPTYDGNVTYTTSGKFEVDNLYLNSNNIYWSASDAEATAWTATNRTITPKQAKDNYGNGCSYVTGTRSTTGTGVTIAHGLGKIPSLVHVMYSTATIVGHWYCNSSLNQTASYTANSWQGVSANFMNTNWFTATVTAIDATNITITWAGTGVLTTYYIYSIA